MKHVPPGVPRPWSRPPWTCTPPELFGTTEEITNAVGLPQSDSAWARIAEQSKAKQPDQLSESERNPSERRPIDLLAVRFFITALTALLGGYMFLGRGFAHVGLPPLYVGEVVLFIGLVATGYAIIRLGLPLVAPKLVLLLVAFMLLGVARTVPYLGLYGINALRDAVLWGYALFALFVFILADRAWVPGALRLYGWVVPVFALWLPISWNLFRALSSTIDPAALGSNVPLVFFKSGDMAVHTVGSIAFLVLGTSSLMTARALIWRAAVALPLTWTIFITGTTNRGALVASTIGLVVIALTARRSRAWLPVLIAAGVLVIGLASPGLLGGTTGSVPTPTPAAAASPSESVRSSPPASPRPSASPASQARPVGRQASLQQLVDNALSIFTSSSAPGLEGTKQFRLRWWATIINYTVFGPYFWTGKGFGINLADADGFQPTADHSLRAPHNSHMTVLARMGVPGLGLWLLLQGAFATGLLRATLKHARAGSVSIAAAGAVILAYWTAAMVNTAFDPYLEGPQGGIWFWTLFGLGLVVIRFAPTSRPT